MATKLEDALRRKRPGYERERKWHRFLVDAHTGGGGFRGRIGCPDAELGSAAAVYGPSEDTYLDRYAREDEDKFARRKEVAHYVNYAESLLDLKVGLVLNKPFKIEGLPPEIEKWKDNVDGDGTTWADARGRLVRRAALVGWAPTLIDTPPLPNGVATLAQAQAAGVGPRLVGLYPGHLTEWEVWERKLERLKIQNDYVRRPTLEGDEVKTSKIDVWYEDRVETYELVDGKLSGPPVVTSRSGPIPLTVLRHKEAEDDPMIGIPMNGQVAVEARRLFNLISALDEALDASCFPVLVLAEDLNTELDEPEGGGEVVVGSKNGLTLAKDASQKHYFLSPPAEVFAALEKRIEVTTRELWRIARVEFVRPAGSQNESGIARKHAFQQTNTAVEDFARCIASWERATYINVGRALGLPQDRLDKVRVVAPDDFDIDDIEGALKRLEQAMKVKLGRIFEAVLKKRVVSEMAPNLDAQTRAEVDEEIDGMADDDASGDAFGRSANEDPDSVDDEVNGGSDPISGRDRPQGAGRAPAGADPARR